MMTLAENTCLPEIIDRYTHVLTEDFFEALTDQFGFQGLSGRPEFLWDHEQRQSYPENYPGYHENAAELSQPAEEYFKNFYTDTAVSGSTPALECADSFFGSENVIFGTDYPFSPERGRRTVDVSIDAVEGMNVDDGTKADIFAGNLRELI